MKALIKIIFTVFTVTSLSFAIDESNKANYDLATRFAPYKIKKMTYSTSINPKWIKGSNRFWYEWKTSNGSAFYIVDPLKGIKEKLFDNDKIAAELTRLTLDPWDGKHLPIEKIKFIKKNIIQFDVTSSQDEEKVDEEIENQQDEKGKKEKVKKKVFHFEYNIKTKKLRQLDKWEAPDNHPSWASVSPDGKNIIFVRDHNLFKINKLEYKKVLDARRDKDKKAADKASKEVELNEIQLTFNGEEDFSYSNTRFYARGTIDSKREKDKHDRKKVNLYWSKDSKKFALLRSDRRDVENLWVIHSVGYKRPELETYKYYMAADSIVSQ